MHRLVGEGSGPGATAVATAKCVFLARGGDEYGILRCVSEPHDGELAKRCMVGLGGSEIEAGSIAMQREGSGNI